jgi:hypothetical protein
LGLAANCGKQQNSGYTTPNIVLGYVHWLAAGGTAETMRASDISWKLHPRLVG